MEFDEVLIRTADEDPFRTANEDPNHTRNLWNLIWMEPNIALENSHDLHFKPV